ncbi:SH3 domain-containing protein [Metabacillus herbersteinensis]
MVMVFGLTLSFAANAKAEPAATYAKIIEDVVIVQDSPTPGSTEIGKVYKNQFFPILNTIDGFIEIQLNPEQKGWIDSNKTQIQQHYEALILSNVQQVYESPSLRAVKLETFSKDLKIVVLKEVNGWLEVQGPQSRGWIYGGILPVDENIVVSNVTIYDKPSTRASHIGSLSDGDQIKISKEINGWYSITAGSTNGWVFSGHLLEEVPAPVNNLAISSIVLPKTLDVYEKPSLRATHIDTIIKNNPVSIQKEINGWYEIQYSNGRGWVYQGLLKNIQVVVADHVNIYEKPSTRANVVKNLTKNNEINITSEINGWYGVTIEGKTGWVYKTHITNGSPKINALNQKAIVLNKELTAYDNPSLRAKQIFKLNKDAPITLIQEINGWYKIQSQTGEGWVYKGILISTKTVNANSVSIYLEPSIRSTVTTTIEKDDSISIMNEINGWYFVNSREKQGWIYYTHLTEGSPAVPKPLNIEAIVLDNTLTEYTKPSLKADKVGLIDKNTPVLILKEINGWYEIKHNNYTSWIYQGLLRSTLLTPSTNLTVYDGPSTRVNIIDTIEIVTPIRILEENNGWYFISYSQDKQGWVYNTHLKSGSPAIKKISAVVVSSDTPVYYNPDTESKVVNHLYSEVKIDIIREIESYYYIITSDKLTGWVSKNAVLPLIGKVTPLAGKTIVLDPGHGGIDSGAVGRYLGTYEKDLNLKTAKLLEAKLMKYGVKVILTRSNDRALSLPQRADISNTNATDAFISIHYNSSVYTTPRGIEALYYSQDKDYALASFVQQEMIKKTNFTDRKVKFQNLHVTRENKKPSILVELGFLSNAVEESVIRTDSYQENVTDGIVNGLLLYFDR